VVVALMARLVEEGWAVVRYDARGAGESGGRASWTYVTFPPHVFVLPTDDKFNKQWRS
jgi:hypothetical protein